jgi:hypothetical protein
LGRLLPYPKTLYYPEIACKGLTLAYYEDS